MTISFPEQFNMAAYFLDDRIEEGRGDKAAVYYEDKKYTYAEVQTASNRMANALASLGVEMEDRVLSAPTELWWLSRQAQGKLRQRPDLI